MTGRAKIISTIAGLALAMLVAAQTSGSPTIAFDGDDE
jgi:hypothetical protein